MPQDQPRRWQERTDAIEGGLKRAEEAQAEANRVLEAVPGAAGRGQARGVPAARGGQGRGARRSTRRARGPRARPSGSASSRPRTPSSTPTASRRSPRCAPRSARLAVELASRIVGESLAGRGPAAPHRRPVPRRAGRAVREHGRSQGGPMRGASRASLADGQGAAGGRAGRRQARRRASSAMSCSRWPTCSTASPGCAGALSDPSRRARGQGRPGRDPAVREDRPRPRSSVVDRRWSAGAGRRPATWPTRPSSSPCWRSSRPRDRDEAAGRARGRAVQVRPDRRRRARPARRAVEPVRRRRGASGSWSTTLLAGKVTPPALRLISQAAVHPRGRSLDASLEEYARLAAERRERLIAEVHVAADAQRGAARRLAAALAAAYGHDVHLNVVVDPEVIGGMSVRIGGRADRRQHREPPGRRSGASWPPEPVAIRAGSPQTQ